MSAERAIPEIKENQHYNKKKVQTRRFVSLHIIEKFVYITLISIIFILMICVLNEKRVSIEENERIEHINDKNEQIQSNNSALHADVKRLSNYKSIKNKAEAEGMKQDTQRVYSIKR